MDYNTLKKNLNEIKSEFNIALKIFKKDDIFVCGKEDVYTKDDKKRLKKKWYYLKNNFLKLKKTIENSKYKTWLTGDFNCFLIKYYTVNLYYDNLLELNKTFGKHEDFIRQQLDEKFKYNYNSIARYMYRFKFLYFLNYHKQFVLLLKDKVGADLVWMIDEIEKQNDSKIEKRLFLDSVNIFYHIKYKFLNIVYYIVKYVGTLFSNIKLKFRKKGLITKENRDQYLKIAQSGDILLTRTNWVGTNISIPGFWKHMSMYLGTGEFIKSKFSKYGKGLHKEKHYIIESVGGGVRIVEFKEICRFNDYLCAIRPRFSEKKKIRAIKESLSHVGKQYDFLFNYHSDKSFVCSELITKGYLKENKKDEGLTISLEKIGLGLAYPPNNLVKKLDGEHRLKNRELEAVIFIDSIEKEKLNFVNNKKRELYDSWKRSRFSVNLD